ncbi:MAG TPA: hypothetical protein VK611_08755 [Acidimicrobiales bacterium]|nr:hypothetical protein [Acidimicrobiales bacterium]
MALVCVTSVRAAPGASTLAVLAAACWPRPVALIEADPSGGALAVRYRLGRTPGLAGLAAAVRRDAPPDALWAHSQMLPGDLPVVVAPESGEVTSRILRDAAGSLAQWCRQLDGIDVIVDCGRLGVQDVNWPLVQMSDETLIVTRPRAEELYPVAHRFRSLHNEVRSAGLVLVGDRPHSPSEISQQLGITVHGVIADDPRAAGVLTFGGSSRGLRRSPLVRSVRTFVDELVDRMGLPIHGDGSDYDAIGTGRRPMGELTSGRRRRRPPVQLPSETPPPPRPTPMGTRAGPTPAIGAPGQPQPQPLPPPQQPQHQRPRRQGPPPPAPPVSPAPAGPPYGNRASVGPSQRRSFTTTTGPTPMSDDSEGWDPLTDSGSQGAIWPSTLNTGGHPVVDIPGPRGGRSFPGTPPPPSRPTSGDSHPGELRQGHQPRTRSLWRGGQR